MRPSVSLHSVLILGSLCLLLLLFSRSYHGNLLISQISGQVANFANTLSCILTCFGFWSAYRDLKFLICLCVYLSQSYAPWEQELLSSSCCASSAWMRTWHLAGCLSVRWHVSGAPGPNITCLCRSPFLPPTRFSHCFSTGILFSTATCWDFSSTNAPFPV